MTKVGALALVTAVAAVTLGGCSDASPPAGPHATVIMEEYAYRVSGTAIPGGTLRVQNVGRQFHMLGLARLKPGKTLADAQAALATGDLADDEAVADQVSMPGNFMGPGAQADITVPDFPASKYVLVCFLNVEGEQTPHFARGMTAQLDVRRGTPARVPKAGATYVAAKGKAVTGPARLSRGRNVLKLERGAKAEGLEPSLVKLNEGATPEAFGEAIKGFEQGLPEGAASKLPGSLIVGLFDFAESSSVYLGVDLAPGRYLLTAEDNDDASRPAAPVERIEITVS